MENLTKPSITRLSRRAGVKSLSEECYGTIRELTHELIENIVESSLIVNSEHNTKTLMQDDIYEGLRLNGELVAQSSELSTNTCSK